MVTERAIINALILGAALLLAPFIISTTLTGGGYGPMLLFVGFLAFITAFFFLKEKLSICPLLGGAVAGAMNFLPLPLQAQHVACIFLILYYLTGYVVIRQKRMKVGKPRFLWPIMIITLIVLYHNHSLSVGVLGGSTEGAKPAIMLFLVVIAYFCGINTPTPSVDFLSKVPLYYIILSGLSSMPFMLTTYVPSLAPYVYSISSSVNVDAYIDSVIGGGSGSGNSAIGRLAIFSSFGGYLQLYLLCHYPIGTWIRPNRWWVAGLSFLCLMATIAAGYRSAIFDFGFLTLVATWCYYSWRALILPTLIFSSFFVLVIASSNNVIHLPMNKLPLIAQRSLSFLPGDWDQSAIDSGNASNNFRDNIRNVYIKEYMAKSPLIGNGFSIDRKEYENYGDALKSGRGDIEYLQAKTFIEGKLFHTGWISVYDIVGIIGTIAFIVLGWNEIRTAGHFVFGPKTHRRSVLFPFYVWLFTNLVTVMVAFFTVFGDFQDTFCGLCIYGIVLSQLSDLQSATEAPIAPAERKGQGDFSGVSGARYGYQSRY